MKYLISKILKIRAIPCMTCKNNIATNLVTFLKISTRQEVYKGNDIQICDECLNNMEKTKSKINNPLQYEFGVSCEKCFIKENVKQWVFTESNESEYDYEGKFRALVGKTNISIQKEVTDDFPHLPLGCSIVLEKKFIISKKK